ncbi:MAG: RDD family protein [Myxococcota bacterium]
MATEKLDTAADIETPEHVYFLRPVAGPSRRVGAYLIDACIRLAIMFVLGILALLTNLANLDDLGQASLGFLLVAFFVLEWGYFVFFEMVFGGRSPGKMASKLRVVTTDGRPLSFFDSVLRNLLRAADIMPTAYGVGLLVMARDRRFRRLGDLVAGTMVVHEGSGEIAMPLVIHPPPTPQELAPLPSRMPLGRADLDAIELFLRRAPTLNPARALELAEIVAPHYARRLGMKPQNPWRFLQLLYARARPDAVGGGPH